MTTRVPACGAPAQTYTQPFMSGECSICKESTSLYRLHRPALGSELYREDKHGKLKTDEKHRLGFDAAVVTNQTTLVDGAEKVEKVITTYFQRVGENRKDEKTYLYADPHTACQECVKGMIKAISAGQILRCHICRADISKGAFNFPPIEAAVASAPPARSSAAGAATRPPLDYLADSLRSGHEGGSANRSDGAAGIGTMGFRTRESNTDRRARLIEERFRQSDAGSELQQDVYDERGRIPPYTVSCPLGDFLRAGASEIGSLNHRLDFSDMSGPDIEAVNELIGADRLSQAQFAQQQKMLWNERNGRGGGSRRGSSTWSAVVSGTGGGPGSRGRTSIDVRVHISRSPTSPPEASHAADRRSSPPPLERYAFIDELIEEGALPHDVVLDEAMATNLCFHQATVRALMREGVLITSILREGIWIFKNCFQFRAQEQLAIQIALSTSVEPASPLGKLYKACVVYAGDFSAEKAPAQAAIRSLINTLGPDRNSIYRQIWITNGRPDTGDPLWAEHNTFRNPIALYLAVKRFIELKLFLMSDTDWDLKMRSRAADRGNLCLLADALSE